MRFGSPPPIKDISESVVDCGHYDTLIGQPAEVMAMPLYMTLDIAK
jgi:hypothetical protein